MACLRLLRRVCCVRKSEYKTPGPNYLVVRYLLGVFDDLRTGFARGEESKQKCPPRTFQRRFQGRWCSGPVDGDPLSKKDNNNIMLSQSLASY